MFQVRRHQAASFLAAVGLLTLADGLANSELSLERLAARLACLAAVVAWTRLGQRWQMGLATTAALTVLFAALYALTRATIPAWPAVAAFWALLPGLERLLAARGRGLLRLAIRAGLAGVGALTLLVLDQVESRFADEEFFVALTGLLLASALFLLLFACSPPGDEYTSVPASRRGRILGWLAVGAGVVVLTGVAVGGYRASFYPPIAPEFPGISRQSPFFCGQVPLVPTASDGAAIWERLVVRVEAEPAKTSPDLAFLALARQDEKWAERFREALLAEARAGAYTAATGGIKSVQFEAAWRVYFAAQMRRAFPALFTASEWAEVEAWIGQINHRAFQVEWVDWLYALAFATPVQGPYANQEIGVGLLSALSWSELAPPELQAENQAFLEAEAAGWAERFRNTDDTYLYQTVWLVNAYLQSLAGADLGAGPAAMAQNRQLSFDWLLLQARPDGSAPTYNHPIRPELAHVAYLSARLLDDPRCLWLADRALAILEAKGQPLAAIPGIEAPVDLEAEPSAAGSCLLYGDSGLPVEAGPLAPDKIVFRDGWTDDATWLLLNLRFSGWHRYKASNDLVGLYQRGEVVVEQGRSQPYAGLPAGRSLPRDKRLARQDLNGLLIPRRGLGQVLWMLTGQGSQWAQDPPAYARVERFETLGGLDLSRTALDDWRGWDQARTIYFFPGGPVFLVDEAVATSSGGRAALTWHLAGKGEAVADGLRLRGGPEAVRLAWPEGTWPHLEAHPTTLPDGAPGWDVVYYAPDRGRLDLVTAYLGPNWVDAAVALAQVAGQGGFGWLLDAAGEQGRQRVLHNPTPGRLEAGGLSTDGLVVTMRQAAGEPVQICYVGGSEVRLPLDTPPAGVVGKGVHWTVQGDTLVMRPVQPGASGCIELQE